jgi:hypothetical protein
MIIPLLEYSGNVMSRLTIALITGLTVSGCGAPTEYIRAEPPPGKGLAQFQSELRLCKTAPPERVYATQDPAISFGACMYDRGNTVIGPDGYVLRPPQQTALQPVVVPRQPPQVVSNEFGRPPNPEAAKYNRIIDAVVAEDSKAWASNIYDIGSMTGANILPGTRPDSTTTIKADYTYNGGQEGSVKARFAGTKLVCLEYWDFPGTCRPQNDIAKIEAERAQLVTQQRVDAVQRRAAWRRFSPEQQHQQCDTQCRPNVTSCESDNLSGSFIADMSTDSFLGNMALKSMMHEDCGAIFRTCVSSCESGS